MTREQLEFLISQYLDGSLNADEVVALEQILARDDEARALLEEHRKLDGLLKATKVATPRPGLDELRGKIAAELPTSTSSEAVGPLMVSEEEQDKSLDAVLRHAWALPEMNWQALGAKISGAVSAQVAAAPLGEELEKQLSEYLEGQLMADEAAGVEAVLASNPAARLALEEDRALTAMLRAEAMPALDWQRVGAHLCAAVAKEAEKEEAREEARSERMRIGVWVKRFGAVVVAACVVVGTMLTVRFIRPPNHVTQPAGELTVQVAGAEKSVRPGVLEVEVGPPAAYARSGYDPYAPSVVTTPRHVQLVDVAPVALPASPYVLE